MQLMRDHLKGVGVALVTPFDSKKHVDFPALENLINHTIEGGINYLVSMGTTGEAVTLAEKERTDILYFTRDKVAGRVPLVAGFSGNYTEDLVRQLQAFNFEGFSAILSASPSYNKPTQAGIIKHYEYLAAAAPCPIIIYNVPSRTASNIEANTVTALASNPVNFAGVKEASNNLAQCMEIVENTNESFLKLSGDDLMTLPLIACGFDGVISVIANAFPAHFSAMVQAALSGDMRKARNIHYAMKSLMQLIFAEGNPTGIKAVLQLLGICGNEVRLPLLPASDHLKSQLEQAVRHLEVASIALKS